MFGTHLKNGETEHLILINQNQNKNKEEMGIVFSAKEIKENDKVFYVFPENIELEDAILEMLDFATTEHKTEPLTFYVHGVGCMIETDNGKIRGMEIQQYEGDAEDILSRISSDFENIICEEGMLVYEIEIGDSLEKVVGNMVEISSQSDMDIIADFDEGLVVNPGDSFHSVMGNYLLDLLSRDETNTDIPEVQDYINGKIAKEKKNQEKYDSMMKELPDFSSMDEVIRWLDEIGKCLSKDMPGYDIVDIFEENGYHPGENEGGDFDGNDRENCGRWIIGQFLDDIYSFGFVLRSISYYVEDWLRRFKDEDGDVESDSILRLLFD